jgi:hypothetical protein
MLLLLEKEKKVELILLATQYHTVGNRSDSYSGDLARRPTIMTMEKFFRDFEAAQLNAGIAEPITTRVYPLTSSPIHYFLIVL